jgi:hypothetical protein
MNEAKSQLDLINCTIGYNTAGEYLGGICSSENIGTVEEKSKSRSNLMNCILWGNVSTKDTPEASQLPGGYISVRNCCIQGWNGRLGGTGNFGSDPLFIAPNGSEGTMETVHADFRLGPGSPCQDTGDNSALPADTLDLDDDGDPNEPIPFDIEGRLRIQNGRVDIGAYESDPLASGGRQ